jgi:hypothetical protein
MPSLQNLLRSGSRRILENYFIGLLAGPFPGPPLPPAGRACLRRRPPPLPPPGFFMRLSFSSCVSSSSPRLCSRVESDTSSSSPPASSLSFCRSFNPYTNASVRYLVMMDIDLVASSLAGIAKSTSVGSLFVSTMPIV